MFWHIHTQSSGDYLDLFLLENNDNRCLSNFCNGSLSYPFENLAQSSLFIESNNNSFEYINLLFLNPNNFINETTLINSLTPDQNEIFNMKFSSEKIIIAPTLSLSKCSLFIGTKIFYFSFTSELEFQNIYFKFDILNPNDNNSFVLIKENNKLTFSNCTFSFETTNIFQFDFLIFTNDTVENLSNNITLIINGCIFTNSLFNNGILNLNSSNSNVWVENCSFINFIPTVMEFYIFNILGYGHNFSMTSCDFVHSSRIIAMANSSFCNISLTNIYNSTFLNSFDSLIRLNSSNILIIENLLISNITAQLSNDIIFLGFENTLFFKESNINNLDLAASSTFLKSEFQNEIDFNSSFFDSIQIDSSSLMILTNSNVLNLLNTYFSFCNISNSIGLIYSNNSNLILNNCYFVSFFSEVSQGGLFVINSGQLFNIMNSIFMHGIGNLNWGIIYSDQIQNVNFINNYFYNLTFGPAILFFFNQNCNISIDHLYVNLTFAFSSNETIGANIIIQDSNTANITNSLIYHTNGIGIGTILFSGKSNVISISNFSIFDVITGQNGIIYFDSNNSISLQSLKIIGVEGALNIGMVFNQANSIYIKDSTFLNFIGNLEFGGVFILFFSNIMIIQNCFLGNMSSFVGSGFFLLNSNQVTAINITLINHTNLNKNYYGGAFSIQLSNIVTLVNSKFLNCIAPNGAAALSLDTNTTIFIESCVFLNLTLQGNLHGQGTIIYMNKLNNVTILNSKFMNSSGYYGGAVFCTRDNLIVIKNSYFFNLITHNQSTALGGWLNNVFNVENSTFINNVCTFSGGVFYIDTQNQAFFTNIVTINSLSWSLGGVFDAEMSNNITIQNSLFLSSEAYSSGGFFYINQNNTIIIDNITVSWSKSDEFGSFIYIYLYNDVSLFGCKIFNTTISSDGGIFYVFQANNLTINDMKAMNVWSSSDPANGGFIYADTGNAIYFEKTLVANISNVNSGGVAYLNSENNLTCENSDFFGISVFFGGTLFYLSENNFANISNIVARNLYSVNFGAIYLSESNNFFVNASKITNAMVLKYDGGLIYLQSGNNLEFMNSIFLNSSSGGYGGFLFMENGNTANVTQNYFLNILTFSLGEFMYSSQKNQIYIWKISINNEKKTQSTISNLFYLAGQNHLEISNFEVIQQNCQGEGCIFHCLIENILSIKDFLIDNMYDSGNFMVITLNDNNDVNITSGEIIFREFTNNMTDYMNAYFNNDFSSKNVTITIYNNINIMYSSIGNNSFILRRDKMANFNEINSFFVSNENGFDFLKISNLNLNFSFNNVLISARSSLIIIERCHFLVKNYDVVFFSIYDNSSLRLEKSTFVNQYNFQFQIIEANNSKVIISKNFFFNLQRKSNGNSFALNTSFSKVYIQKNIFIRSINSQSLFFVNLNSSTKDPTIFKLIQNSLQFCNGTTGSTLYLNAGINVSIEISQNTFKFNNAEYGGDLYLTAFSMIISNNVFYKSIAKTSDDFLISKGASIYFSDPGDLLNIFLLNNVFSFNEANVGSPLFFDSLNIAPNFSNNSFFNDSASIFGSPFASKAMNITFLPNNDFEDANFLQLSDIISGVAYPDCLFDIFLVDYFGNLMIQNDENVSLNIIQAYSIPSNMNNTINYQMIDGHFCFNGPFTRNQPIIPSTFSYDIFFRTQIWPLKLVLAFRNCEIGERMTESYECIPCESGTYSFVTDFTNSFLCEPCVDSDPFVCNGGSYVIPKNDYWRLDMFSNNFLKCPKNDICFSSNSSSTIYTGDCVTGYSGPLCNACANDYGKVDRTTCTLCSDSNSWSFFFLINFKILFKSFYFIYSIYMGFKMTVSIIKWKFSKKNVLAISLLKVLITHFQILSFIPQIPLKLTNDLVVGVSVVLGFFPDISDVFFFDCYFKNQHIKFDLVYFVLVLTPVYIFLIYFVTLIIIFYSSPYRKLKEENNQITLLYLMKMLFYVVVLLSFVDVSQVYLEMFQCVNIGDENRQIMRLYNNLNINCTDISHLIWAYGFSLPILVLLVETIFTILIKMTLGLKETSPIVQTKTKFLYGYFFYPYKKKLYFWDFISLTRRGLILFIFLYFYDKLMQKNLFPLLLIYVILAISFALVFRFHPYDPKYGILNRIEATSILVLVINFLTLNLYCSFYFYKSDYEQEITPLTIIILLFINSVFLLYWAKCYYSYCLKGKINRIIQKMFSKKYDYVFYEKIKRYLIENEYYCDFKSHLDGDPKKLKINLIMKAYDDILLINRLKIGGNQNKSNFVFLIKKIVLEKKYFKLGLKYNKRLVKNELVSKSFELESKANVRLFDVDLSVMRSRCNYFEYFLKYSINLKIFQDFEVESYGIFILQEQTSIKYNAEFKVERTFAITNVCLSLVLKLYDTEFKGVFIYVKQKNTNNCIVFKIPIFIDLFLCHIPMKKISLYFDKLIKYAKLDKLPHIRINSSQTAEKCLSTIKVFFPNAKEGPCKWGPQRFTGLVLVLPKKNLFLFFIISYHKSENYVVVEFYSFENKLENEELECIIGKLVRKFKKALSYNRFIKLNHAY